MPVWLTAKPVTLILILKKALSKTGYVWDGTFNGKAADTGTDVWMIKATDYAGTVFEKRGTVVLVR
jgi:hypothetical protein